jgi:hypothetical protein
MMFPSNSLYDNERMPAWLAAECFDGGKIEGTDTVDHGLVQGHACCGPFFPL